MSLLLCLAVFAAPSQSAAPITVEAYAASRGDQALADVKERWPLTAAESSGFSRSSTLKEVEAFLAQLQELPEAERLTREVFGKTTEGRDLTVVTVRSTEKPAADRAPRKRVLINANIHGGEIEGKVATQILLREFALGYHSELLDSLEIAFVPVFNADGNDRISRRNRASQNGPDEGVGERANAAGLDLNRDFVKLETPEVRALTTLIRETAPHAFMDLHTTNGSPHGYDLTYASSLSPNVEPALASYMASSFFPRVRETLRERDGMHIYDYGNFGYAPRKKGSGGERGDPVRWSTYDSRPRFGTNLMGLRGTVSILSEAYSYLSYERRVLVTYAFVLESLRVLSRDSELLGSFRETQRSLGVDAQLDSIGQVPVRVSSWEEVTIDVDPDTEGVQGMERRVAPPTVSASEITMDVQSRFRAGREVRYTGEFLVLEPSPELLDVLEIHLGPAALRRVGPEGAQVTAQVFLVDEAVRSQRVFQGHREVSVEGTWEERSVLCPPGALRVTANALVAHLLHPESDDSLTTWNFFDEDLLPGESSAAEAGSGETSRDSNSPDGPGLPKEVRTHPVHMIQ